MAIYAVHSPALDGAPTTAFDRARVLRLGFAVWGLVLGPIWLLVQGLWLALAAWIGAAAIVGVAIAFGILQPGSGLALYALAALFIGIEARALQSSALTRRGLPLADIVSAPDSETAELAFLVRALAPATASAAATAGPAAAGAHEIIGLFPSPSR